MGLGSVGGICGKPPAAAKGAVSIRAHIRLDSAESRSDMFNGASEVLRAGTNLAGDG